MRSLRELLLDLRVRREDSPDLRAEHCLESLFDSDHCVCGGDLGEREQAALEAERRRWTDMHGDRPVAR